VSPSDLSDVALGVKTALVNNCFISQGLRRADEEQSLDRTRTGASPVERHGPRAAVMIGSDVAGIFVAAVSGKAADAPQRKQGVREPDFDGWLLPTATAAM
jgi:hypothetical protein